MYSGAHEYTNVAEALFGFIDRTIDAELARELAFLAHYDKAKRTIQEIADMPDRKIDLFIRFCLQNNGRISAQKRLDHFDFLLDEEITGMEQAMQTAYSPLVWPAVNSGLIRRKKCGDCS